MCVIFFKPSGVALPKTLDMKKMYWDNDDGMGYMRIMEDQVVGEKFHTVEEFLASIFRVPRKYAIVGHFRTATHGGRGIEYAQPFPFPVEEKAELLAQRWNAPLGVAHNGIISGFGDSLYGGSTGSYYSDGKYRVWKEGKWVDEDPKTETTLKLSDTQDFLWFLSSVRSLNRAVSQQDPAVLALLKKLISSRWAFMSKQGKVRLIGTWTIDKGIWYSNLFWQSKTEPPKKIDPPKGTPWMGGSRSVHYPTVPLLSEHSSETAVTTPSPETSMEVESNLYLQIARDHCANWTFCTRDGKDVGGCLETPIDRCVYFETAVRPMMAKMRRTLNANSTNAE